MDGRGLLGIYLSDHQMGAAAGTALFRRAARNAAGTPRSAALQRLSAEVAEDCDALQATVRALGLPVRRYKQVLGGTLEKVGRLKPNGHLLTRSPLSDLVELEGLRLGVEGKQAGWVALREVADSYDALDPDRLDLLIARAVRQGEELEQLRRQVAAQVLRP